MRNKNKKAVKKEIKEEVEKKVDAAEKEIKKKVKKEVEKEVEKEEKKVKKAVKKEVEKEVGQEVQKELRVLRRPLDIVGQFKRLEIHHKFLFAIVVGVGVIAFWRGIWLLIDLAIFPGHPWFRGVFVMLLGLTILASSGTLLRMR